MEEKEKELDRRQAALTATALRATFGRACNSIVEKTGKTGRRQDKEELHLSSIQLISSIYLSLNNIYLII